MATFDPYKAGEYERKQRIASMLANNAYTAKTKSEQANIDRRAKMIELLQGQADAPIERFSYNGIEAYTPPAAYLGKILSGAMAGYQSGKAGREQAALDKYKEQAQTQDMNTMIEMMNKGTGKTDVSSIYDTSYIKDPAKRAELDAYLSAPTTSMSQSQPPSYTGGALNITMPTAQPSAPVTEIQERRYSMRTPEGQMELLKQIASDKQSRAEMLSRQLERQDEAQKAAILEEGRNERARLGREATTAAAGQRAADALKPKPLSTKDLNVVKAKLANIRELKKQYNTLKSNFDLIKNTGAVGLTSAAYKFNENAQKYDTALNTMRNLITGLTRIPGVGSQSDLEARIANQSMPERTYDKGAAAMEQQLNALNSLISGYEEVSKGILDENQSYYPSAKEPTKPENSAATKPITDNKMPASITVNGKTYERPSNMTDEDWNSYKKEMGVK